VLACFCLLTPTQTLIVCAFPAAEFYGSLGLDTTVFNQHVIIETNKSTERLFSAVPDVENPRFFEILDVMVKHNTSISKIGKLDLPQPVKTFLMAPFIERMVAGVFQLLILPARTSGSVDLLPQAEAAVVY
jgi:magnesium-protoporphyrin IX monomethyl ester (oxidative) cyclase